MVVVPIAAIVLAIANGRPCEASVVGDALRSPRQQVELNAFSVDTFPAVTIRGDSLVIRHRGRRDVPPLVERQELHRHVRYPRSDQASATIQNVTLDGS